MHKLSITMTKFAMCMQSLKSIDKQLKGYSSGQSHFSKINAKLAEENEFVTHFVQKCLETRENEQNVVLNESSEALGNRSEIVRILILAMTTADDDVGGNNSVLQVVAHFSLFYKQNGAFGFAKSKATNFSFKDYFDRAICNFQRFARQKTIQILSSSKFKSSLQHAGTRLNLKKSLHANITE